MYMNVVTAVCGSLSLHNVQVVGLYTAHDIGGSRFACDTQLNLDKAML